MTHHLGAKQAQAIAAAAQVRTTRIAAHTTQAIRALHDAQPGYPAAGAERGAKGGHADPTADLALSDDHTRNTLDEVTGLYRDLERITDRLDVLTANWGGANTRWRSALRTEAAAALANEHNWCAAHQTAGLMEPTRHAGGRLCRRCEEDRRTLGVDPPTWMIEKRHNGRSITTIDVARAKREAKARRKRKR